MEKLTYQELRELAIKAGIPDHKIAVGMWIKLQGYVKHHYTNKDRKSSYFYTKD